MDDYISHITKSENKSLLTRIYGAFTIKTKSFADVNILMMSNLYYDSKEIVASFDLKGSTIGREVLTQSKITNMLQQNKICNYLLKDIDFININNNFGNKLVSIDEEIYQQI